MTIQPAPGEVQRWIDTATEILPASATKFEVALLAAELHHEIPVPIADLWRPGSCPEALLPYLAWALSVDVWQQDWPVEKKRDVVRSSFEMHRLKGTLEGIRRYAALADGEVVRAIVPPARSFLSAGLSLSERLDFMRRLPEIRILQGAQRSDAMHRSFCGSFDGEDISSFDCDAGGAIPAFYQENEAALFFGRRARLIDSLLDIDIPLVIEQIVDPETGLPLPGQERYLIPGSGWGASFFDGGPVEQDYFGEPSTAARVISVSILTASMTGLDGLKAATEGLAPIAIIPERVAVEGLALDGVYCNSIMDGWHFVSDLADQYLYDSIRLHDRDRDIIGGAATSFMNDDRFGIAPHTAELLVSIRDKRPVDAVDDFVGGFFVETPPTAMHRVLDAIEVATAAHETVLVDTEVDRVPVIGGDIFIGHFRLGLPVRG